MTLRRALAASPLAVLVAVLAHVAAFGFSHAPGADRSGEILGGLAVALGCATLAAFWAGLFAGRETSVAGRTSGFAPLLLALAGVAAFGLIECSEGHGFFASLFESAWAAVPLAYAVAWLARAVSSVARSVGVAAGSFVRREPRRLARSIALASRERRASALYGLVARGRLRGRAPPLFI